MEPAEDSHLKEKPEARERRALEIVEAVLRLSEEQQSRYLDEVCADDTSLRETVFAILRGGASDDSLLAPGSPWRSSLAAGWMTEPHELGSRVGPFRLLRELGRGGMGVVYLAQRADGHFDQEVALKLLPAYSDEDLTHRMEAERQILATLEHPSIARLLDGGVTAEGQPYFAMEYVKGRPIDRYCAEEKLGLKARLELFRAVCEAVASAHSQLVVHRDLKPTNILVTDAGQVKLLDFGIARLVSSDLTQETQTMALTLGYASPEQFRGEAISVATDVYQLGVLLYELLTGHRPFDDAGSSWVSQIRATLEQQPPPPSRSLLEAGRQTWARRVVGDLDHIVLRALRPEPAGRYVSVDRLSADVGAYLVGRPVEARKGGTGYLVGKFLRRHSWAVALSSLGLLMLTTLVTFYTWRLANERDRAREALNVAQQERAAAQQARVAAQQARDEAEEVVAFLGQVFASSDPRRGNLPTTRELLDRGAARIEQDLAGRPRVQARLSRILGDVYGRLGLYEPSETLLLRAFAHQQRVPGGGGLAKTHISLGHLRSRQGRDQDAENHYRAVLEIPEVPESQKIDALLGLASTFSNLNRSEEVTELYSQAIELIEARPDKDYRLGIAKGRLANLLSRQGRFIEAETLYVQAVAILETSEDKVAFASVTANQGLNLSKMGSYAEAEAPLNRSLAILVEHLGSEHPDVAVNQCILAASLIYLGREDEATHLFRRAIPILRAKTPDHRYYPLALNNYGNLLLARREFPEARKIYEQTLAILEEQLDPTHQDFGISLANLGEVLVELAEFDQARETLGRSLEVLEKTQGKDGLHVSWPLFHLGRAYHAQGDWVRAESLYRRALKIRLASLEKESKDVQEIETQLRRLENEGS